MSTNLTNARSCLQIYEKTGFPQKEVQDHGADDAGHYHECAGGGPERGTAQLRRSRGAGAQGTCGAATPTSRKQRSSFLNVRWSNSKSGKILKAKLKKLDLGLLQIRVAKCRLRRHPEAAACLCFSPCRIPGVFI